VWCKFLNLMSRQLEETRSASMVIMRAGGKGSGKAAARGKVPGEESKATNLYSEAGAILALTTEVDAPLNPRPVEPKAPPLTTTDLVPPRGPAPSAPPGLDASQQFRREVSNAVAVVAQVRPPPPPPHTHAPHTAFNVERC
jgi:hypothetical protein